MPISNKKSLSERREKAILKEDEVLEKMVGEQWYYFVIENHYDSYEIDRGYGMLIKENKSYGIIYTIDGVRVEPYQLYADPKDFFYDNNNH